MKDFDVFVHGFYNAAALPRILNFRESPEQSRIPLVNVVGLGAIRTFTNRFAVFGSFNFGTTPPAPASLHCWDLPWRCEGRGRTERFDRTGVSQSVMH